MANNVSREGSSPAPTEVFTITGVRPALSEDQGARTRKYLISMFLRTACFVGAVIAEGWLRWVLIAGAVFLPYIAVVIANAGRESRPVAGLGADGRHTREVTSPVPSDHL